MKKITNTFKHLRIGMLAGIIALFLMIALIPDRAKEIVGWTAIVVLGQRYVLTGLGETDSTYGLRLACCFRI